MKIYEMATRNIYNSRTSGPINWQNREYVEATFVQLPLSETEVRATHSLALMICPMSVSG